MALEVEVTVARVWERVLNPELPTPVAAAVEALDINTLMKMIQIILWPVLVAPEAPELFLSAGDIERRL